MAFYLVARLTALDTSPYLTSPHLTLPRIFQDGKSPLLNAAQQGDTQLVSLLLDKGAEVNHIDNVSCLY
jgi:ankyrin repeat protein